MKLIDTSQACLEQASRWWLRLREDDVRPDEIGEWLDWCQADPANLQAFEKVETLGGRLEALDAATRHALMRELIDAPSATPPAAPAPLAAPFPASPSSPMPPPVAAPGRRVMSARFAMLAILPVLLAAVAWWFPERAAQLRNSNVYATQRAQRDEVRLADGSRLTLGAATRVKVDYSPERRDLEIGSGEAYFEVAHNRERPFAVRAGRLKIVAVGTAFNIRRTGERVEVVVTEGVVDVEDSASRDEPASVAAQANLPHAGVIRVAAGQLIVADLGDRAVTVRPANKDAALAWRRGSLQFVDEELGVVVANLNRYTHDDVVIADPALAQLRYTGTVVAGHEAEWLAAIEKVFPISVQRDAQGRAALSQRKPGRS